MTLFNSFMPFLSKKKAPRAQICKVKNAAHQSSQNHRCVNKFIRFHFLNGLNHRLILDTLMLAFVVANVFGCSQEEPSFEEDTEVITVKIRVGELSQNAEAANSQSKSSIEQARTIPSDQLTSEILDRIAADLPLDDLVDQQLKKASTRGKGDTSNTSTASDVDNAQKTSADDSGVSSPSASSETLSSSSSPPGGENGLELPTEGSVETPTNTGGEGGLELPPQPTGSSSQTPSPQLPPAESPIPVNGLSAQELKTCALLQGVKPEQIMIIGHKGQEIKIDAFSQSTVLAYKLVGDRPRLVLDFLGQKDTTLGGLCLFLTAHESQAQVKLDLNLTRLVYIGRGDQSRGTVEVLAGRVLSGLAADLSGNQPFLQLGGPGQFPCQTVKMRGNSPQFICQ